MLLQQWQKERWIRKDTYFLLHLLFLLARFVWKLFHDFTELQFLGLSCCNLSLKLLEVGCWSFWNVRLQWCALILWLLMKRNKIITQMNTHTHHCTLELQNKKQFAFFLAVRKGGVWFFKHWKTWQQHEFRESEAKRQRSWTPLHSLQMHKNIVWLLSPSDLWKMCDFKINPYKCRKKSIFKTNHYHCFIIPSPEKKNTLKLLWIYWSKRLQSQDPPKAEHQY